MRNDEVSRCLDYIRFTSELEGFSLSDGDEEILCDILNGDASAEGAVREYIQVLFGNIYLSNSSNAHNLCRCLSDELAHLKTTI